MTDDFNSPSQDDLRAIARARPALLKQRLEKEQEATAKKMNLKPGDRLCKICGEKIKLATKVKSDYCAVCTGRLDAGETALVTIDLRWMFISPDKLLESMLTGTGSVKVDEKEVTASQIEAMKGRVIGVLPGLMDVLEIKAAAQNTPETN